MFKRTGWRSDLYETFFDIYPLDDSRDHAIGDECWCSFRIEYVEGGEPDIMIIHQSDDGRELREYPHAISV